MTPLCWAESILSVALLVPNEYCHCLPLTCRALLVSASVPVSAPIELPHADHAAFPSQLMTDQNRMACAGPSVPIVHFSVMLRRAVIPCNKLRTHKELGEDGGQEA